jgi:fructan beta-fructosidase
MRPIVLSAIVLLGLTISARAAEPDVLLAGFEGDTYGDWKATGDAFGPGPAHGTLPGQMPVSGFEGKGLVNSFFKGDNSTGTLTSPPLAIQRKFVTFLIGGGMHPGKTCINLLIDGKVVRTATGPNDKPGGTERLDWHSWDVADLAGKTAVIEIVDKQTGGWGHVNIDHISQSDRRSGVVETSRELLVDHNFFSFCFASGQGTRCQIGLSAEGKPARQAVGHGRAKPSWITWDVSSLKGQKVQLRIAELPGPDGKCSLAESVTLGDEPKGALIVVDKLYGETYRPQFHFSPAKNWTNDPNGLVYYAGEYHLFFQHNPEGVNWGSMTWGHAVSPDLLHWKQLDHAIYPDELGTIFSGSAVVDHQNTSGFQTGGEKPIVCIYTSAGKPFTQSIAYSVDRGRTWTKYAKNPVLAHIVGGNRDPKVIWHEPTRKWIMALYLDKNDYALFSSPNLKEWQRICDVPLPGAGECPDFFPIAVDGDAKQIKWLFWGGNGTYRLGTFDGAAFKPQTDPLRSIYGANDYAAQTYSDIPAADGRRIQIAWMVGGKYPDMPFNQQMTIPRELTLRTTPEGPRLHMMPVREIESLRVKKHAWTDLAIAPGSNPLEALEGELWDIEAEFEVDAAARLIFAARGEPIRYDAQKGELICLGRTTPMAPQDGRIKLRVLVDRTTIEIFAADGRYPICSCFLPDPTDRSLSLSIEAGKATAKSLTIHSLKSAWR